MNRRRNPVLAITRRILANEREMWRIWKTSLKGRITDHRRAASLPEALPDYRRTLRRAERLNTALDSYLP